jgi:hypothetical protein
MITLRRVTDPVTLPCPYCDAPILTADEAKEAAAVHAKSQHGERDLVVPLGWCRSCCLIAPHESTLPLS